MRAHTATLRRSEPARALVTHHAPALCRLKTDPTDPVAAVESYQRGADLLSQVRSAERSHSTASPGMRTRAVSAIKHQRISLRAWQAMEVALPGDPRTEKMQSTHGEHGAGGMAPAAKHAAPWSAF
jgi:hypothetical protein